MDVKVLSQLEEGTLIKIKGKGFFGKTDLLVFFDSNCVYDDRGYMFGCTLYPFSWISLATRKDFLNYIERRRNEYERAVKSVNDAYAKTVKARKLCH